MELCHGTIKWSFKYFSTYLKVGKYRVKILTFGWEGSSWLSRVEKAEMQKQGWQLFAYLYNTNITPRVGWSSLWLLTLSDMWFANVFSHSVGYLFIFLVISFAVQKLSSVIKSHSYFFFYCLGFWFPIQEIAAKANIKKLPSYLIFLLLLLYYSYCFVYAWLVSWSSSWAREHVCSIFINL